MRSIAAAGSPLLAKEGVRGRSAQRHKCGTRPSFRTTPRCGNAHSVFRVLQRFDLDKSEAEMSDDRDLTLGERTLVRWLLRHGSSRAGAFADQADRIRVVSRCACGCASINFVLNGRGWHSRGGTEILSDFQWHDDEAGREFGEFVFAKEDTLAGLEVWPIDGRSKPASLPDAALLMPY